MYPYYAREKNRLHREFWLGECALSLKLQFDVNGNYPQESTRKVGEWYWFDRYFPISKTKVEKKR